jgi:hypothetical protein
MASDYEVGYGKPPEHTRFKKGQSGNPKGRPKGSRNFSTEVKEMLQTKVKIGPHGRQRTVSTQAASLMRLREKALNGDARALDRLLEFASRYNDEALEIGGEAPLDLEDKEILRNYEARVRRRSLGSEDPCA